MIAFKLDYSNEKIKNLCIGGMLHDIGKLMIPKNILQKPGKLNDQKMSFMKQHCELGYSMIKDLDLSTEITDIILQHHERLDGSGYPYGLHSDQISDNAKIVMIADALDAMTSYRPYQNSRQVNEAMEELKKDESKYSRDILELLENYLIM
jgi:putative nucleotidyltransferase with HDIG domain